MTMTFEQQMKSLGFVMQNANHVSWYEYTAANGNKILLQNDELQAPYSVNDEVEVSVVDDEGVTLDSYAWGAVDLAVLVGMIKELNRGQA